MTRWIAVLVLPEKVLISTEFNWWMNPEQRWQEFFDWLNTVIDESSFHKFIEGFNITHFRYDDTTMVYITELISEYLNLESDDNFKCSMEWLKDFTSDYVYIKNLSWNKLKAKWKETIRELQDNETMCYWDSAEITDPKVIWNIDDSWVLREYDDDNYVNEEIDREYIAKCIVDWSNRWELTWGRRWELSITPKFF